MFKGEKVEFKSVFKIVVELCILKRYEVKWLSVGFGVRWF